jgi:hypothetical protein
MNLSFKSYFYIFLIVATIVAIDYRLSIIEDKKYILKMRYTVTPLK